MSRDEETNKMLAKLTASERVSWSFELLPGPYILSSSFGIQAAVTLHLVTQQRPDIPVIFIDTGYLFHETYQFVDQLTARLSLNLKVYRPHVSSAWQEARFGKLWEQGVSGLDQYNRISKLEPMARALDELEVATWFSGLRREQSSSRTDTPFLSFERGRYKVRPIADWTNADVWHYLKEHDLPYHPLWKKGYVSVGDVQTTRPLEVGMSDEQTRFSGLQRECGLHTKL